MNTNTKISMICFKYYIDPRGYLAWGKAGIGRNIFFLFLTGFVSIVVLFIYEAKVYEKIRFRKNTQIAVGGQKSMSIFGFCIKFLLHSS